MKEKRKLLSYVIYILMGGGAQKRNVILASDKILKKKIKQSEGISVDYEM